MNIIKIQDTIFVVNKIELWWEEYSERLKKHQLYIQSGSEVFGFSFENNEVFSDQVWKLEKMIRAG